MKNNNIENRAVDLLCTDPLPISIGFCCAVASTLEVNEFRYNAFPFDWIWTPFDGLCALIEDDFKDFLNPDFLIPNGRSLLNTKYNIAFHHDFPVEIQEGKEMLGDNYLEFLEEVQLKYQRRINRFYEAIKSKRPVYLIRGRYTVLEDKAITQQDVIKLRDILFKKFPEGNWTLVILDVSQEYKYDWGIERVKNFYLSNDVDPWAGGGGDSHAWKEIFEKLGFIAEK